MLVNFNQYMQQHQIELIENNESSPKNNNTNPFPSVVHQSAQQSQQQTAV
jgi:hypothetical protein